MNQFFGFDDPPQPSANDWPSGPLHSITTCPVCDGGLCGIRICTGDDPTTAMPEKGFVMCDECEAVWLEPDIATKHIYVDSVAPKCPICRGGLWGCSRWAERSDLETLGWMNYIDPDLDVDC